MRIPHQRGRKCRAQHCRQSDGRAAGKVVTRREIPGRDCSRTLRKQHARTTRGRDRRSARKRQKYRLLLYIIPYHHTKISTAWLQLRRALRVLRYPAHAHARAEDGQCPICAARAVKSLRLGTGMRVCHGSHVWRGRQSDTVCRVRPGCMRVKIPHCRICHYLHPNLHRTDRSIRAGPILRRPPILTFNN